MCALLGLLFIGGFMWFTVGLIVACFSMAESGKATGFLIWWIGCAAFAMGVLYIPCS